MHALLFKPSSAETIFSLFVCSFMCRVCRCCTGCLLLYLMHPKNSRAPCVYLHVARARRQSQNSVLRLDLPGVPSETTSPFQRLLRLELIELIPEVVDRVDVIAQHIQ